MGKLIIEISDELHAKLKHLALSENKTLKDLITKVIKRLVK